ncbi:phospholipase D-like domain-containing protein [Ferrimonas marina]|uniref:Phosphatidylserine/phosphatidylglycerophosphate/cardiolipin synthase n=1 Tax=Ferrimonas marina TaxID=299255 RepID=A0A1M5RCS6_9GAMM|nr:phospholipase D family protein [Ferrimonas marina]SHH24147.1 Phosphatidylserine/phosphatidylglycerophosphate/cardiolipin synthase [Ferrimonas marina]
MSGKTRRLGLVMLLLGVLSGCGSMLPDRVADLDPLWQPQTVAGEVYLVPTAGEALAHRIQAVREAEQHVDLIYFTWNKDLTGAYLYHELLLAAERGVSVRVLLDDLLEFEDPWLVELDRHANIEIRIFNPFHARKGGWMARAFDFQRNKKTLNHRLHQKYFRVDDNGFMVGGRNIGDDYFGYSEAANFFDLDTMVKGPAQAQFDANFTQVWHHPHSRPVAEVMSVEPKDDQFRTEFEALKQAKPELAATIEASVTDLAAPEFVEASVTPIFDDLRKVEDAQPYFRDRVERFLILQDRPAKHALVSTPYMLPTHDEFEGVVNFIERDASVTLLTNSLASNDSAFVGAYYNKYRKPLLEMGLEIYEYDNQAEHSDYAVSSNTFYHNKAMVLDGQMSYVGSSNFDPRSDHLNLELGLMIDSPEFAQVLEDYLLESQRHNYWHATLNDKGKVRWQKGEQRVKHNPNTNAFHALPDWFFRTLNFKSEL